MDESIITTMWVNDKYVVLETSANITHQQNSTD